MTIKEFLTSKEPNSFYFPEVWLKEFAQIHVYLALQKASNELVDDFKSLADWKWAKQEILKAYPESNIV